MGLMTAYYAAPLASAHPVLAAGEPLAGGMAS